MLTIFRCKRARRDLGDFLVKQGGWIKHQEKMIEKCVCSVTSLIKFIRR